jgi:hypothetical protein
VNSGRFNAGGLNRSLKESPESAGDPKPFERKRNKYWSTKLANRGEEMVATANKISLMGLPQFPIKQRAA